jgi:large subunit ribosomal protein L11
MARKNVLRRIKIELEAGNAAPAEVGKMLGPYGVNLREIMQRYNELTAGSRGNLIPVEVTVFEDRSHQLRILTPPTSFLLRRAAGIDKGSAKTGTQEIATLTYGQLREIALCKLPDLNTDDLDAAVRSIAGTARSMGIAVASGHPKAGVPA